MTARAAARVAALAIAFLLTSGTASARDDGMMFVRVSANTLYQSICKIPLPLDPGSARMTKDDWETVAACTMYLSGAVDTLSMLEGAKLLTCEIDPGDELPFEQIRLMFRKAYEQAPELGQAQAAGFIAGRVFKCRAVQ